MNFDLPLTKSSIIKVIGVGGGGGNAVNHMKKMGIEGVNFVVCNTDEQALENSSIVNKIQLGPSITEGLGAGSNPEIGRQATEESIQDIIDILNTNTKMVFITAGMGGGTGTGSAPLIAKTAKEMGILTVGIVTEPFDFEGSRRIRNAKAGIAELAENVDSLLVISNDKIVEMHGNMTKSEAFAEADNILTMAAKSISEIITKPGSVNVDFADVKFVMSDSGVAVMGTARAAGQDRAMNAIKKAINSPLLNENKIRGAQKILINISTGNREETVAEIREICDYIQRETEGNGETDLIYGTCHEPTLEDEMEITIICTDFVDVKPSIDNATQVPQQSPVVVEETEQSVYEDVEIGTHQNSTYGDTFAYTETNEIVKEFESFTTEEDEFDNGPVFETEPDSNQSNNVVKEWNTEETSQVESTENNLTDIQNFRKNIMRKMTMPLSTKRINEMEKVPAYARKGKQLDDNAPHSSERSAGRYQISEEDNKPKISRNGFLHDNVD